MDITEDVLDAEESQFQKRNNLYAFRTLRKNTRENVAALLNHKIPENKFTIGLIHAQKLMKKWGNRKTSKHPAMLDFVQTVNTYITSFAWKPGGKISFERNAENGSQLDNLEAKYAAYLAEINGSTTPDFPQSDTL